VKRPISDEFVQSHNSPWSDEARRRMEESDGIDLMDQDVPADHEIERSGVGKAIDRRLREVDMKEPARPSPLPRNSEDLRIAIDADDRSGRANELTGHYRNVAGATTEIRRRAARFSLRWIGRQVGSLKARRREPKAHFHPSRCALFCFPRVSLV
jgi:hypothetical protein